MPERMGEEKRDSNESSKVPVETETFLDSKEPVTIPDRQPEREPLYHIF